jgi:capsular polysaccharide transport system permease protein
MSDSADKSKKPRASLGAEIFSWNERRPGIAAPQPSPSDPEARDFEDDPAQDVDRDNLPEVRSPQFDIVEGTRRLRAGRTDGSLPRLPQRPVRRSRGTLISFLIFVVLPTLFSVFYFSFIASRQYVSEFRFSVQSSQAGSPTTGSSSGSGVSTLLGALGGGVSPNASNNYIVTDYLNSMQAVRDLQQRIKVIDLYSRSDIDWWSRFNSVRPLEWFVSYWQRMTTAQFDPVTGIASVQIRAFSPEDAKLVADTMLKLSEELINRMVARMQGDTVRFAQNEVQRGEDRVKAIRAQLTEYRNKAGVIDPNGSLVASNSQLVQNLRANLAQLETQLASLKTQRLDNNSPLVRSLNSQIKAVNSQITAVENGVSKNGKGAGSLSDTVAQYERLDLERQFAQTMLTNAQQSLDQARAVAAAQFLYIEPYVRPSLPESALYPKRLYSIGVTALFAFVAWTVLLLTARSIREHYT